MRESEFPAFFGDWVKQRRKILDLTQEELAQNAGCSVFAIRKIEAGERRPSKQLAGLFATALKISEETQEIFIRAARGELNLNRLPFPSIVGKSPPNVGTSFVPSQLPIYFTTIVGRETELAALNRIFNAPNCRLLTLTGLGGMGKTRLAVEFASSQTPNFPGGIYFIPLASLNSPELIVPAIAEVLCITFSGSSEPKEQLINIIENQLKQPGIFILDNMEHLLPTTSSQNTKINPIDLLVEMLQRWPLVKFLVTSRERLNLHGEWTYELQGLPTPPQILFDRLEEYSAPMLFIQNARRTKVGFTVGPEDRPALVRICHLLEGIPLAIELAATWVGMLSCEDIANEIESNIKFLTTSMRDIPERHRSLHATFDHSWKLLSEEEQGVLCRLSVFRGGFDRRAAEEVAGASLSLLASLISKSLVQRTGDGRYNLHEVINQYSHEQLTKISKLEETSKRHFEYFLDLAEEKSLNLMGVEQLAWFNRLEEDHDNLRVALEWSLRDPTGETIIHPIPASPVHDALRLVNKLYPFWKRRSHWTEGRKWLQRALEKSASLPGSRERANALNAAALLAAEQADTHTAYQLARENLDLSQSIGDQYIIASALNTLGVVLWKQKKFIEARAHCEKGLVLFRELGNLFSVADTMHSLGHITINQGDYEAAQSYLDESLLIAKKLEYEIGIVEALADLGLLAYLRNNYKLAQTHLEESLIRYREANLIPGIVSALNRLGDLARCLGDYEKAGQKYTEALNMYRDMGDLDEIPSMLHNLGYIAQHRADYSEAMALFKEALVIQHQTGNLAGIAECLLGIAGVLSALGHVEKGARLFGTAEALRKSVGASLWPADQVESENILSHLRESMDVETLKVARAEGQGMSIEEVIKDGLERL